MTEARKILIVDDSLLGRLTMKKSITSEKYTLLEASDGLEALDIIAKEKPDLVFLDLLMPNLDGIGVLEHLKKENIKMPVIIVSADIQKTTRELCFNLGAMDFVNKPIEVAKLDSIMEQVFG